ncbi:hypothetical protein Q3G72_035436 [Acer saccharum]|nr:hypothetical protein Q3G72_035436 [Acer saccharum]
MASDCHESHATLFSCSRMPSQPYLNTFGHLPSACRWNNQNKSPRNNQSDKVEDASNENNEQVVLKENNNFERHGRSKSRMVYHPISKTTYAVPLKNVFVTLNDISKSSLHNDTHEVSNDDKPMKEVQVDSSAIGNVSSGSEMTSLKASNTLSSTKIVAFSPSELEIVEVGSSNSNLVKTMDATKASNMISFNMNDDASTRQHTGPIILHNSTPILNSNTGPMESDLQDRRSFKTILQLMLETLTPTR